MTTMLHVLLFFCVFTTTSRTVMAQQPQLPLYWNVGAFSTTTIDGIEWLPDPFSTDVLVDTPCFDTTFDWANSKKQLVCRRKEWTGGTTGNLEIPVPSEPAMYEADLIFSESDGREGARVMDVLVEGTLVYPNIDIVKLSQSGTSFFTLTVTYPVTDNSFTLRIDAPVGNASLAGISLKSVGPIPWQIGPSQQQQQNQQTQQQQQNQQQQQQAPVPQPVPQPMPQPVPQPVPVPQPIPVPTPFFIPTIPIAFIPVDNIFQQQQRQPPEPTGPFFPPLPLPTRNTFPPFQSSQQQAAQVSTNTWRINMGSFSPYTDDEGNVWSSDTPLSLSGFPVDACTGHPFEGLSNPPLSCVFREWSGPSTGTLEFPVAVGRYAIKILLSETEALEGTRVVNVKVENRIAYTALDVTKEIGGRPYGIFTLTATQWIQDGAVSIELVSSSSTTRGPVLAAVEIVPVGQQNRHLRQHQDTTTIVTAVVRP